jgi:hypothetical protein
MRKYQQSMEEMSVMVFHRWKKAAMLMNAQVKIYKAVAIHVKIMMY